MIIEKSDANNVKSAIFALHKKCSENLQKDVSPFTGLLVTKNDGIVGIFTADGYEPRKSTTQSVKDGDRITFVLPAAGG
jgi:hypothetical protein